MLLTFISCDDTKNVYCMRPFYVYKVGPKHTSVIRLFYMYIRRVVKQCKINFQSHPMNSVATLLVTWRLHASRMISLDPIVFVWTAIPEVGLRLKKNRRVASVSFAFMLHLYFIFCFYFSWDEHSRDWKRFEHTRKLNDEKFPSLRKQWNSCSIFSNFIWNDYFSASIPFPV